MSVIGIDIGGTNIRIGHDDNGELKDFVKISTKDNLKQGKIVECLADIIKKYINEYCNNDDVQQIAIGIPATLSADRKEILQVPNIKGMNNIRLGEELEKVLGIKVALERDVHMLYFWDKYEPKSASGRNARNPGCHDEHFKHLCTGTVCDRWCSGTWYVCLFFQTCIGRECGH